MNFSLVLTNEGRLFSSGLATNGRLGLGMKVGHAVFGFTELDCFKRNGYFIPIHDISVRAKHCIAVTRPIPTPVGFNEID